MENSLKWGLIMKGNKINVTITINKDIWELAKVLLPCSRSNFIEQSIINYINSNDELETLRDEIREEEQRIAIKKQKLKELEKVKELNTQNKEIINKALETVFKIVVNNKEISQTQIKDISRINKINESVLIEEIKKQGWKITKYTKEERKTTVKKLNIK